MAVVSMLLVGFSSHWALAQEETPPAEPAAAEEAAAPTDPVATLTTQLGDMKVTADTMWVLITAMLVFFMNLGFACVESGFCRAKNAVNILSKNFIVFAVTSVFFWLLGFGLMFGDGTGFIGKSGLWALSGEDGSPALGESYGGDYKGVYGALNWTGVPLYAKFFFQLVFAGTAATIVSGAVAERIKYIAFIFFSAMMAILIYPVVGHWIWGGGWLAIDWGFLDFAGSTQVHSIGGWAALMGIIILGPRIGKYTADGKPTAIPGHNMTAATIGCFVLWLGWFGFNPGSTMAANPGAIAHVCVTTNMAAAMATLTATATCWILLGKPDLGMTLNGCLAGLVAITAPCAYVSVVSSLIIGGIAGVIVVLGVLMFDRLKVDDPVGATSVHLLNGIFGTLCVGLFGEAEIMKSVAGATSDGGLFFGGGTKQLVAQLIGVAATAVYVIVVSGVCWMVLKATLGIRVSPEEEMEGLDQGEHGNEAYHGFVMAADSY